MEKGFEMKKGRVNGVETPIQCLLLQYNRPAVNWKPHYHDYIELVYALEGVPSVLIGGMPVEFSTGDLVVINSRETHDIRPGVGNSTCVIIQLMPQILYSNDQSIFELKYMLPFILNSSNHQRVFKKSEIAGTCVPEMIQRVYEEWQGKQYGYELAIRAEILKLFLWILRYWDRQNITVLNRMDITDELAGSIQKAVEYTTKHYNDVSANEVAQMCNLSYSYFCRSFKRIMQRSFSEFVNYIRIGEAEKLLVTTDQSITEIALNVGFSTQSYFIQQFKKANGLSPKQFRLNFKKQLTEIA